MRLLGVLLVGAAEADVGPDRDHRWPVVRLGGVDGGVDRGEVIAILDALGVPAVCVVPRQHVLGERPGGRPIELDPVVVVQHDQPGQPQVPGQRARLRRDALLEVAVGADDVGPMIDDLVPVAVEFRGEPPLRDRHADGIGQPLAQRAGGRLDARGQSDLRVAGGDRAPLPERLEVVERDVVPGEVEERVQQHRGVARGQHEAVPVRPRGRARRMAEVACPERVGHRRGPHGRAGVPRVGLLDPVDGQRADGVDGEPVEAVRVDGHRSLRVRDGGFGPAWGAGRSGRRDGSGRGPQSYRVPRRGPAALSSADARPPRSATPSRPRQPARRTSTACRQRRPRHRAR